MPFWVLILIRLAIKLGLPWLITKFPWIPKEIIAIIEKLIGEIKTAKYEQKNTVRAAKRRALDRCAGVACPTDLTK